MSAAAASISAPALSGWRRRLVRSAWLAAGATLLVALAPRADLRHPAPLQARSPAGTGVGQLLRLPLPAQAVISETLGQGDRAYHVRGLAARNAAQGFSAAFGRRVILRAGGERLGLGLARIGRGDRLAPVAAASPSAMENRVEYRRGAVTEWYVNGPLGLEQGVTLTDRPAGSTGPLTLAVSLSGTLTPTLSGRAVVLSGDDGPVLRLRGLFAVDARGNVLPSRLELRKGSLLLRVDDRGARYPVTVDPFAEQAKLAASDGASIDQLGVTVAVAGDTAVVGAWGGDTAAGENAGAAYVFVRSGSVWSEQQKLAASDGASEDAFGVAVAVAGDTAVIGAYSDDTAAGADAGSAYVFVRDGARWSEQQKLTASDGAGEDFFGLSVAVDADTAVVGAFLDDLTELEPDTGSAYVFVRSGTVWSEQQKLLASDAAVGDAFGVSVAVAGATAVVGASSGDTAAAESAGSAYVFVRDGSVWSEQQKLAAADGAAEDAFGGSVAVAGDTVVVGASSADTAAGLEAGSAYVFLRTGSVWSEQQKLTASDAAAGDGFGVSVAVAGDAAVIGAWGDDTAAGTDAGSAYVFVRSASTWAELKKLTAAGAAEDEDFGVSVAVAGETVVVGANFVTTAAGDQAGTAFVFGVSSPCALVGSTLLIDVPVDGVVSVVRSGGDILVKGAGACVGASAVTTVDTIQVRGDTGSERLTIDLSGGAFAPGASAEESGASAIEWNVDLGAGSDEVVLAGSDGADTLRLGSLGINLDADDDSDITVAGVELTTVDAGLGDDVVTGTGSVVGDARWSGPLHLNGGSGMDKLTGGLADDVIDGGPDRDALVAMAVPDGADVYVGGSGVDTVSYARRVEGVFVTLDLLANDGSPGEGDQVLEVETILGGKGGDVLDARDGFVKNTIRGGGGDDELFGGPGADQLIGDLGADRLFGGAGNDTLSAQDGLSGNDTLDGGPESDVCKRDAGDGAVDCEA